VNKTVEKSAKEAKEERRQWVTTMEQGLDRIRADPEARMTLAELKKSGFDEKKIAGCIVMYCGGRPEDAEAGLKAAKNCGKALADSAEQLSKAASYVEKALAMCEEYDRPVRGCDELPETLRRSADALSKAAGAIKEPLKNIRIKSSISSGRDDILLGFAYALCDGKKPSVEVYLQIAKLVAAVTGEYKNYKKIAERLSKAVKRLAGTELGRQLIMMAEEDYPDLKTPTLSPRT
jgi:hypothetical protein